jgi:AcrR family transcriptional regulator
LIKDGYEGASTNRIAAVAGVSVGSLYQYFPSKEALVEAVVERHAQKLSRVVRDTFVQVVGRPIEIGARELVMASVNAHRVEPKLHRILDEQAPRSGRMEGVDTVVKNACALFRHYLEAHRNEIDVADFDLAAFIVVTTVEALTHSAVINRPDMLAGEKSAAFVEEVAQVVLRYLQAPSRRPKEQRNSSRRRT